MLTGCDTRATGPARLELSGLLAERRVLELDLVLAGGVGDQHRALALLDRLLGDDALLDIAAGGQLELDVEQRLLEDRAEPACAGLALERLVGDRAEGVGSEDELDVVELEEALELPGERIARLGQDRDQVLAAELVDRRDDRKA